MEAPPALPGDPPVSCTTPLAHPLLHTQVIILDIRYPTVPVTQLQRHTGPVNALAWAPHSAHHICTAGQDHQVGGRGRKGDV
jgi:hypothetical protein